MRRRLVIAALLTLSLCAAIVGVWSATRPIYGFRADRFSDEWAPPVMRADGSRAAMVAYESTRDASRAARQLADRLPTSSIAYERGAYRYVRRDNAMQGAVLAVDRIVLYVEARSAADVDTLIAGFPFVAPPEDARGIPWAAVLVSLLSGVSALAVLALHVHARRGSRDASVA